MSKPGLGHIATDRLQALLRVAHAGRLGLPVSMPALMLAGFGDIADQVPVLLGLDGAGLRAALVIVLSERRGSP